MSPEAKERQRIRMAAWRAANKERIAEYNREYRLRDVERHRERSRRWTAENQERHAELERLRIQRMKVEDGEAYGRHLASKREEYMANREHYAAYNKAYYAANIAEQKRKAREWVVNNPERRRATLRAWNAANPGKLRQYAARRRGSDCDPEYAAVLLADPCSYCGAPADTIDHIVPVAVGGDGGANNLTAACRSCNSRKQDRSLLVFLSHA